MISQSAVYAGYMETYSFSQGFTAMDFFKGRWPFIFVSLAWAYFLAPEFTIDEPAVPITALSTKQEKKEPLSRFSDIASALTAYMTPSATAAVAMCMSAGGYDVKSLFKMGWLFTLLLCVGYVVFVSIAYPAF